jgi:aspartyl/asparaginyl beta-hydroxylase (cupin superfamily)
MANMEDGHRAALEAADRALAADPRDPGALIAKGDALAGLGDSRAAASFYSSALRAAGDGKGLAPAVITDLRRVQAAIQAQAQRFEAHLTSSLAGAGFNASTSSDRFALSLDLMAGRKRLYQQEPRFYLFPGLPQIQFQPRETLPWLTAVEAAASEIRAELDALLAEPDLFRPYVDPRSDRPNTDASGMLSNADWSALFLWKDGEEQADIARRCPRTLAALAEVPLCRVPGRTPSILFSKLKAGARIPPHHGLINTRLICHLPLIAPSGSRFRVGNDTRDWREGHAWAFDDTIEHEAANDSGQDRTILIFDVWKPEMSEEERALVSALFQAVDAYGAGGQAWGV